MVSKSTQQLPYFVRKQVTLESQRITHALGSLSLQVEVHGHRVLILEHLPHPRKNDVLRSPLAMLDFKDDGWHLLFRTTNGHWQPVPDDQPTLNLSRQIDRIIDDPDQLFWRI